MKKAGGPSGRWRFVTVKNKGTEERILQTPELVQRGDEIRNQRLFLRILLNRKSINNDTLLISLGLFLS